MMFTRMNKIKNYSILDSITYENQQASHFTSYQPCMVLIHSDYYYGCINYRFFNLLLQTHQVCFLQNVQDYYFIRYSSTYNIQSIYLSQLVHPAIIELPTNE